MTTLENWYFCPDIGYGPYCRLSGNVYNHPNFKDGEVVFPSFIVSFNKELMQIITASGRTYQLGKFKHIAPTWTIEKAIERMEKCI